MNEQCRICGVPIAEKSGHYGRYYWVHSNDSAYCAGRFACVAVPA
jgi:hypothetical protein